MRNVANAPSMAGIVSEMKARMEKLSHGSTEYGEARKPGNMPGNHVRGNIPRTIGRSGGGARPKQTQAAAAAPPNMPVRQDKTAVARVRPVKRGLSC